MSLKHSYTLLAPFYDTLLSGKFNEQRKKSLIHLGDVSDKNILINGIGTGLDIPFLPEGTRYTGSDITPAMIKRAKQQANACSLNIKLVVADSQTLPFSDQQFDIIVMHLILTVVPYPALALSEANRVLKPGGKILIFDKFIKPGQLALGRRLLSFFIRHIATRTDVVFEAVLKTCPELKIIYDEPALAKGWFRLIELRKL